MATEPEDPIITEVTHDIAHVARALVEAFGLGEDDALNLAVDIVLSTLAAEAPRTLAAFRRAVIARNPAILAPLN